MFFLQILPSSHFVTYICFYFKVYERIEEKSSREIIYGVVKYKGDEYTVGTAVFLQPDTFNFKSKYKSQDSFKPQKENVDEDMYPEFYRKSSDHVKGSNLDTPDPFCIAYINKVYATTNDIIVSPSDIHIKVNKLYRPENTHKDRTLMEKADLNMVYWSDESMRHKLYTFIEIRYTRTCGF